MESKSIRKTSIKQQHKLSMCICNDDGVMRCIVVNSYSNCKYDRNMYVCLFTSARACVRACVCVCVCVCVGVGV